MNGSKIDRRAACRLIGVGLAGIARVRLAAQPVSALASAPAFRLRYVPVEHVWHVAARDDPPEVRRAGRSRSLPRVHGSQREQIEEMGLDRFAALEASGQARRSDPLRPGPSGSNRARSRSAGAEVIVTGSGGLPVSRPELKASVKYRKMKPRVDAAARAGVAIGIENHANALVIAPVHRYFAELAPSSRLSVSRLPPAAGLDSTGVIRSGAEAGLLLRMAARARRLEKNAQGGGDAPDARLGPPGL